MASKNYLIVCGQDKTNIDSAKLSSAVGPFIEGRVCEFNLPQGALTPKFGSFDNLIKLTDDLVKFDSQTEGCLRRLERQFLETFEDERDRAAAEKEGGDSHFTVTKGQEGPIVGIEAFINAGWKWDEAKYPPQRSLQKNLEHLLECVQKIDEDCRSQGQAYSDVKGQKSALTKQGAAATFPTRDLVDLLTPKVVKKDDFIETEHLTTVVVILGRGQEAEFKKWYENPVVKTTRIKDGREVEHTEELDSIQTVIPGSAEKFEKCGEDKDGNTVWRVVLFKSCKDKFQSLARQSKFTVRDFEYNPTKLEELESKRKDVEADAATKLQKLQDFCKLAWSDVFTAWLHVKAMRCFVECVLRYGLPSKTKYAGFIICPKAGVPPQMADVLARFMGSKGPSADDADGEEYSPYVSVGFAPRAAQVAA